ncbi:uncharacterized protein LOC129569491 [Sitodiplosis mosellana]|uniref:uncharacterized protein LOC129569491 n=1 Tax=Sitodiplosis mosellana TaxID=263140 RepID=UPI0024452361|nr:uncharacterized protein LOC129569491 [Sitodiplosis mosellana]
MPLIWDDNEWLWLNDEKPYNKSQYVVARKLCVKQKISQHRNVSIPEFSTDQIRRHLRKFGEIESIKLPLKNDPEAHVTFASSQSAYFVKLQHDYDKKTNKDQAYEIELADSWEQPPETINQPPEDAMEVDDEQTSKIFMLNEKCLLHLFQFLDLDSLVNLADVCKMFNRLLHQHCFPCIRKYEVTSGPEFVLSKVRRTLLCIGNHITDLKFKAVCDYKKNYTKDSVGRTSKFLRVIAQNVGVNVRRASLSFNFKADNRIKAIAPILRTLESLEIEDREGDIYYDIDFQALCPNLIDFTVNMEMSMMAYCKPWPSLRSLSVKRNMESCEQTLLSFVQQNPQLTCLKLGYRITFTISFTKYLTNLEKLSIFLYNDECRIAEDFDGTGTLPSLRKIKMDGLDGCNLKGAIDQLSTLQNLRKISLYSYSFEGSEIKDYSESLVNLAKKLPLLEQLNLRGIPVNADILVNIVLVGRQLKVLHIYSCQLDFSDELIVKLVETLKVSRKETGDALQLCLGQKDLDKLDASKSKAFERYLHLKLIKYKQKLI